MKLESDRGITAIIMLVKEENLYPTIFHLHTIQKSMTLCRNWHNMLAMQTPSTQTHAPLTIHNFHCLKHMLHLQNTTFIVLKHIPNANKGKNSSSRCNQIIYKSMYTHCLSQLNT